MKILTVTIRIMKQMLHQKRMMLFFVMMPVVIFTIFYIVFEAMSSNKMNVGLINPSEEILSICKSDKNFNCHIVRNKNSIPSDLQNNKYEVAISFDKENRTISNIGGSDYSSINRQKGLVANLVAMSVMEKIASRIPKSAGLNLKNEIDFKYLYPIKDFSFFDSFVPIFFAMTVFFLVFMFAGVVFLKERTVGTMSRILLTPLKPYQLFFGYFIAFGVLSMLQTLVLQLYAFFIIGAKTNASMWSISVISFSGAICVLAMGFSASMLAKNEFEVVQFIPIAILPQVALCGLFDISRSKTLSTIAEFMPLKHVAQGIINLSLKNQTLQDQWFHLLCILLFTLIFSCISIVAISRYRPANKD